MSPKMRDEIKSRLERAANVYGDDRAEWPDETFLLSQAYDAWEAECERADELEAIADEAVDMLFRIANGKDSCSLMLCRVFVSRIQELERKAE